MTTRDEVFVLNFLLHPSNVRRSSPVSLRFLLSTLRLSLWLYGRDTYVDDETLHKGPRTRRYGDIIVLYTFYVPWIWL